MSISPYSFPGLKLDQKDKQQIKNNTKLLRYKITKEEILEIIAESLRDVILIFIFLAFQSPVKVSTNIANPTRNKMPEIGKKNAPTTASNFVNDKRILANNMNNCIFICFQIFQSTGMSKIFQARRHQASRTKLLQNTLPLPFHKLQ